MRRLTSHLLLAALTFTTGVTISHLGRNLFTRPASVGGEIRMPNVPVYRSRVSYCEVHSSILKSVRVQWICGEYRGGDGDNLKYISVGCSSQENRLISPEDARFLGGGSSLKNLRRLAENDAVRDARFPHGYGWEFEDCEPGEERCIAVHSCAECRAAEVSWKRSSLTRARR